MEEFKGIKGKWTWIYNKGTIVDPSTYEIQREENNECIAEYIENKYDAILIENAPELLKALQEARALLVNTTEYEVGIEEFINSVKNIDKLINKALGNKNRDMKKKEIKDKLYELLADLQEVGIAIGSEEHNKFISDKKRDEFAEVETKLEEFIKSF